MVLAVLIALVRGIEVPWGMFGYYTALLAVMAPASSASAC
jgi:ABC-2 type transport system permease protein